jgi:hypothetical protein
MFELENYDIFFEDGIYKIKYWFKNLTNKEVNAVIKFIELPFRSYTRDYPIKFTPNATFWVCLNMQQLMPDVYAGLYCGTFCGVDINIEVDKKIEYKFSLPWTITNNTLRKGLFKDSNIHKKKFWLIGDSNANYGTHGSKDYVTTKNYDIVPVSVQGLSLSRFLNSDWKRFMNTIPIWKDDIIALEFGTADIEISLHRRSKTKNTTVDFSLKELLQKYSTFLKEFKKHYPNRLIILAPNRPVKDGWDNDNRVYPTTELRVKIWREIISYLVEFCKLNNIEFYDYRTMTEDIDGSIKNEYLIEGDIHFKIKKPMMDELKSIIEKL